jgi:Di-haem oxidoreductase, putative peroxidase
MSLRDERVSTREDLDMNRSRVSLSVVAGIALTVALALFPRSPARGYPAAGGPEIAGRPTPTLNLGEGPVITVHLHQKDIDAGRYSLDALLQKGRELFTASFNLFDGAGRPEATGNGTPTPRPRVDFPNNFNRASGPEADSCAGCHNMPRPGGGGDNVANVFVLAGNQDFTTDISPNTGDERNTLGMWGSGAIEMLAREMTADLQAIRKQAIQQALSTGQNVTRPLSTKGVSFGQITAHPDGSTDTSGIEGVDADLIIKPFHQKGVVVSLRQFTINAYNQHHGMQANERFGDNVDFDHDGVVNELTRGDITAATLFQAALEAPGQVIPRNPVIAAAIRQGEATFTKIGCASCHVPALILNDPHYTEPNPYNPPGNLRPQDVPHPFSFDLTRQGPLPRLERMTGGHAIVRCFTDLKRHHMGAICNNEKLVQAGVPTDEFITKKLWGFYSEPPFMHNGRCTTVTEAINTHGGEAQAARDAWAALPQGQKDDLFQFLKSLQVLPPNTPTLVVDENGHPRPGLTQEGPPRSGPFGYIGALPPG